MRKCFHSLLSSSGRELESKEWKLFSRNLKITLRFNDMSKLKAPTEPESKLSGSTELESSKLERAEVVNCPAFDEIPLKSCLSYQATRAEARFINPNNRRAWEACRSGCPNSLIGPDGNPIELDELEPKKPDDGFIKRIKELISNQFKDNDSLFARKTGLSPGGLKRYLSGGDPSRTKLVSIAKAANVNLLWLATGEGPMRPDDQINDRAGTYDKGEYAYIPLYDVEVSAGGGSLNDHEQVIARMAFLRSWLNKIGLQEKDLAAVRAHGDSMEPTITEGDMLLVDKNQRRPGGGHIYIMCVQGALVVKRLSVDPDGRVRVISDNKLYPDSVAPLDHLDIVGRVVWAGGLL